MSSERSHSHRHHHQQIEARLKRRYAAARRNQHHNFDERYPAEDDSQPILLSNRQVLELLQERQNARLPTVEPSGEPSSTTTAAAAAAARPPRTRNNPHRHRDWLEQQVVQYVQQSVPPPLPSAVPLPSTQHQHTKRLTPAETLQIYNLAPTKRVELHLMVEDLDERLTGRQQEELLQWIAQEQKGATEAAASDSSPDLPSQQQQQEPLEDRNGNNEPQPAGNDSLGTDDVAEKANGNRKRPLDYSYGDDDVDDDRKPAAAAVERTNGVHYLIGGDTPSNKKVDT